MKELLRERFTYNIREINAYHSKMGDFTFQLDTQQVFKMHTCMPMAINICLKYMVFDSMQSYLKW